VSDETTASRLPSGDREAQIAKLKALIDDGSISAAEYQRRRSQILAPRERFRLIRDRSPVTPRNARLSRPALILGVTTLIVGVIALFVIEAYFWVGLAFFVLWLILLIAFYGLDRRRSVHGQND